MTAYLLSLIIFVPLFGALIILAIPSAAIRSIKYLAIAITFLQIILAGFIYSVYEKGPDAPAGVHIEAAYQLQEKAPWINLDLGSLGTLSIEYFVAVDGISITMVLLAAIVMFIGAISSLQIQVKVKGYFFLYLLLSGTVMGCFLALDFFLFYLFFEFMLLPMYFLIGLWGGPRREYASIKFFLYTLAGSIFILIAMISLYISVIDPAATAVQAGLIDHVQEATSENIIQLQQMMRENKIDAGNMVHTFNMVSMADSANFIPGSLLDVLNQKLIFGNAARLWVFLALFIGFAIKLPAVPLHTWLPDAHVEAPTPVSVVLAGILLKIGAYGIIRTAFSIFPEGAVHYSWLIGFLGILSIIYGGFNALAMRDLKKLIAYSSVAHMGFVLLGLASGTAEGISGAIYQMFSHGIIASMLFLIAGVLYERTHNRMIEDYSGLATKMPYFTIVVVIAFFASLGLPGFSGFIAEFLIFLGAFNAANVNQLLPRWMAIVATLGLILGAAYYLWTLQRMFFGKYFGKDAAWDTLLRDLRPIEYVMFLPLIILTLFLGLFPQFFLDLVNQSVGQLVTLINQTGKENLELILRHISL